MKIKRMGITEIWQRIWLFSIEERDYQSESFIFELNFKIKKHHMRRGGIEIRCAASIMNGYHSKSKLEEIFVKTHNAENLATHNYEYRYVLKIIETWVTETSRTWKGDNFWSKAVT